MNANSEAQLNKSNTILIVLSKLEDESAIENFFGRRLNLDDVKTHGNFSNISVYLCGDIAKAASLNLKDAAQVCIIEELSFNFTNTQWPTVGLGKVPLLIHDLGVYFQRYFEEACNHFEQICNEHAFQSLTESSKPSSAHRKGIYLTPVTQEGESLHFRLLRCSTNLSGPTRNFSEVDRDIVQALNIDAARLFDNPASLNHVLAQVYRNAPATESKKQTKARISAHADKTKDMPQNGIMAFCTFYSELNKLEKLSANDFDYGFKGKSGMTKLSFKLKKTVQNSSLPAQFTVVLYPNSVFFMSLSTNRLYTHEIRSSVLDAEMLPTRMGYVVRCSSTEALHSSGCTYLKLSEGNAPMEVATDEGVARLRELYAKENNSDAFVEYGEQFLFSMNQGDYAAPER